MKKLLLSLSLLCLPMTSYTCEYEEIEKDIRAEIATSNKRIFEGDLSQTEYWIEIGIQNGLYRAIQIMQHYHQE